MTYAKDKITQGSAFETYSEVYVPGVTGENGTHSGIIGQMGYVVADPTKTLNDVTWTNASRNELYGGEAADKHDEYMSPNVVPAVAGSYVVFYRYSADNGSTWTYCDGAGVATELNIMNIKLVTVTTSSSDDSGEGGDSGNSNPSNVSIGWCAVTWPDTHFGVTPYTYPANKSLDVYAQVYAEGVTGENGTHSGITAQFGYLDTVNSNKTYEEIIWNDARLNENFDYSRAPGNDEYMIAGEVKPPVGQYVAFYRFSGDGGKTWTFCDGVGVLTSPDQLDYQNLAFFQVQ